ncbi:MULTISPECIES: AraC family transcriptional regulator ligand-binding domain-containing protein [Pseudomonas]|uniref:AraC family transcriptional regulator ligand-binding domain-containing protein n=1 Tax=Pseudomonadaceae TaxID=135621 RepID=UPI0009F66C49|nr:MULTISPECIES: AraC family transcriptional regulator ligand-binding domain-containing protein [Pseudomonas]
MTDTTEGRVISASLLLGCRHLLPPLAKALGHGPDALLPGTSWPLDDFLNLLEHADEGPLPHIGLYQGTRLDLGALGLYGQAVQSACTFGEALRCAQRHLAWLVTPARLELRLGTHGLQVEFRLLPGAPPHTRQFDELILALLANALAPLTEPSTQALRLELAHPAPNDERFHRQAFACPIAFERLHNRLHFPRAALERPLRTAQPALHRHLLAYLDQPPHPASLPLDIPQDEDERWEWVKYQLRTRGHSLAEVARQLGVSSAAVKNAKRLPYPRVERAIAALLELAPAQIWPERRHPTPGTTVTSTASTPQATVASAEEG